AVGDDEILARITRRSARELALGPGLRVYAQIKSVAIRNTPAAGHLDQEKIL
ncbi:MAG: TOBE domain-containing protein, partial [Pseudomonadota bacterium]